MRSSRGVVAVAAACALGCGVPAPEGGEGPAISREGDAFRVAGLGAGNAARLAGIPAETWPRVFSVSVVGGSGDALFGEHRVERGEVVFEPRFPLRAGVSYRAVFDPSWLPGGTGSPIEKTFSLPEPAPQPPAYVRRIHPSRDALPENLLKFYLHFSAAMSRGEAYRRIRLAEAGGRQVELPFLELGEELWDRAGTRLTLFFDPGRIKRGLKPREEAGPALEEGKAYVLVVDREWPDAGGRPLREEYRKAFKVEAPDDRQPDPGKWKLDPPRAATVEPLSVTFDEPLDEAMLHRALAVVDAAGTLVAGRVEVDRGETGWRWYPEGAWKPGRYGLVVDAVLEDLAGNSVGQPFEVDVFRPVERKIGSNTVTVAFEVVAR